MFPQNSSIVETIRTLSTGFFEFCQTLKVNFFNYIFHHSRKSFTNIFHLECQSSNYCYLVPNLVWVWLRIFIIILVIKAYFYKIKNMAGALSDLCNPSNWEAIVWGWLDKSSFLIFLCFFYWAKLDVIFFVAFCIQNFFFRIVLEISGGKWIVQILLPTLFHSNLPIFSWSVRKNNFSWHFSWNVLEFHLHLPFFIS